jgi:hypothetical protein
MLGRNVSNLRTGDEEEVVTRIAWRARRVAGFARAQVGIGLGWFFWVLGPAGME